MDWSEVIRQGGAWVLAVGVGYAVLSGRLRLDREIKRAEESEAKAWMEVAAVRARLDAHDNQMVRLTDLMQEFVRRYDADRIRNQEQ